MSGKWNALVLQGLQNHLTSPTERRSCEAGRALQASNLRDTRVAGVGEELAGLALIAVGFDLLVRRLLAYIVGAVD
jgi:hypothetical protein